MWGECSHCVAGFCNHARVHGVKKRPRSLDPGIHVTPWSEHPGICLASLLAAVTRAGTMGDARCKSNGGVVFSIISGIPITAR